MKGQDAMPNFVTDEPPLLRPLLVTNASSNLSPPKLLVVRTAVESAKTLRNASFKFEDTIIVGRESAKQQKQYESRFELVSFFMSEVI